MSDSIEALCARLEAPWSRVIALVERTYADGKVTTIDPLREEAAAALREQAGEIDLFKQGVKFRVGCCACQFDDNDVAVTVCSHHEAEHAERDALQARVRELEDELADHEIMRADTSKALCMEVDETDRLRAENEGLKAKFGERNG